MAETAVRLIVQKLGPLLLEEIKLLKDVSTEVGWIKAELESMQAFLKDADERAESDAGVKTWVSQVRDAAYDIEDVLDEYVLRLVQGPIQSDHKVMVFLRKTVHRITHLKRRHGMANEIQELKTQVADISSRRANYDLKKIEQGSSSSNAPSDPANHLRSNARFSEEADLVGIDNPRNDLIGLLVDGESRLMAISVTGMGGLGKTTLAGKVYESDQVKTHFKAFAWVTVSQTFSIEVIFRSMLKQICGGSIRGVDKMEENKLIEELRSHLQQKRYVIVLDDLWEVDHWECIKVVLPNGECGSRIMVTTRKSEVAAACARTSDHVYNLSPLPFQQGWALFCKKAFQSDLGGNCPPNLKPLSEKIVQKCGGLPLAIAAIGSLLWTKSKTLVEWQKLYNSIGHQKESSGSLTSMSKILSLTFNDLPYELKPCFMYVSIFPEDYLIKPMRLIQLWVAEGFVKIVEGMTLEEVADGYLQELINRSLIQVASYTDYGTIESCRVHDVIREIILSKAREEKFLTFSNGTKLSDKTRRLGLHDGVNIVPKDLSHVRTFVMFRKNEWPKSMNTCFSGFRLLKVLDLEGTGIDEFPSEIVNLIHLKFLSLRNTKVGTLPESIYKLKNLETLDLYGVRIREIPNNIVKLEYLRHLIMCSPESYHLAYMDGVKVSPRVGSLRSLQQLGFIKADEGNEVMIRELGKLTQLKWLGISHLTCENGSSLCASIEKMTRLSSLSASSADRKEHAMGEGPLDLKSLSSPPPLLEKVVLRGVLEELPHWISSLSNLLYLKLDDSWLKEDPFSALQHLPNLLELKLMGAYKGEELYCEEGGFQRLNSLFMDSLYYLKLVRLEKGAMPRLQKLGVSFCDSLEKVPYGIEHLTHLRELDLFSCKTALMETIERDGGEDHWRVSHIPRISFDRLLGERNGESIMLFSLGGSLEFTIHGRSVTYKLTSPVAAFTILLSILKEARCPQGLTHFTL